MVDSDMKYIVCAYYTSKKYENMIKNLEESLEKFSIPYTFKFYNDRGSWKRNTGIKPEFILDMLDNYKCNIVYLDADCVVKKYPDIFDNFSDDIGIFFAPDGDDFSNKVLTGTIIFNNNEKVKNFIKKWIIAQNSNENFTDQDSMELVLTDDVEISFLNLPFSYVKIFDKEINTESVIEHYQASRKYNEEKIKKRNFIKRTIHKIKLYFE